MKYRSYFRNKTACESWGFFGLVYWLNHSPRSHLTYSGSIFLTLIKLFDKSFEFHSLPMLEKLISKETFEIQRIWLFYKVND